MNRIPSSIDVAALLEMLGGEKQILTSLLSKFAEELTSELAASAQAIIDHDADLLRQIAHRIEGTSANLHALCSRRLRLSWSRPAPRLMPR